jgi:hydrogenase nickel incorporation protein HypA/HybF
MHEYSIVQALLDRVEREARTHNATAVHRLSVRIGALAGVQADLLASAYEICRTGTLCDGAELAIDLVPVRWACPECGREVPEGEVLRCSACGSPARLASGDEIMLDRIEMEVA